LFGEIITVAGAAFCRPNMHMSRIGKIINDEICVLEKIYGDVSVYKSTIMPNHIHLIIMIDSKGSSGGLAKRIP